MALASSPAVARHLAAARASTFTVSAFPVTTFTVSAQFCTLRAASSTPLASISPSSFPRARYSDARRSIRATRISPNSLASSLACSRGSAASIGFFRRGDRSLRCVDRPTPFASPAGSRLPAQQLGIRAAESAARGSSSSSSSSSGGVGERAREAEGGGTSAVAREGGASRPVGEEAAAAARAAVEVNPPKMFYSSASVDRAGHHRNDAEWLKEALSKPTTMVIPWSHGRSLIQDGRAVIASPAHIILHPARTASAADSAAASNGASNGAADAAIAIASAASVDCSSSDSSTGADPFCFLGLIMPSGHAAFAVAVDSSPSPEGVSAAPLPTYIPPAGAKWVSLRSEGPTLPAFDAGLLAYANGLMEWHSRHRFCSQCAAPLIPAEGGYARRCSHSLPPPPPASAAESAPAVAVPAAANGTSSAALPSSPSSSESPGGKPKCSSSTIFPRLDPAVIMCVTWGDFVLLGRQSRWSKGRYSVLAGFVEVGETFEMGVVREVWEEARVHVDPNTVKYHASQPWPFPSSLMVAFTAQALASGPPAMALSEPDYGLTGEERAAALVPWQQLPVVRTDTNELEDARWFHRDFIRALLDDASSNTWLQQEPSADASPPPATQPSPTSWTFPPVPLSVVAIPGPYAIARSLVESWAKGQGREEGQVGDEDADWPGAMVPDVDIDTGIFKYVLIRLTWPEHGRSKLIVRGDKRAPFHMDVLQHTARFMAPLGLKVEAVGGGRINHDATKRQITIYGFSQAFGRADHKVAAAIVRRWYPLYSIATSNHGY
ncbi:hypothetical protein CLOM_g3808 [Closterium sp. NIES-68]|nr:hypothetical protein CLOM_g3808 [Closterium sp. NIES-68]GJP79832.1 hypothetical protein CLOP_g10039 [Closterium sp. NIES-67]